MKKIMSSIRNLNKSALLKNSFWGIASSGLQNLFLSGFFVIIARQYPTADFAQYLIANALYQLLVVFSSLGLGQWFIREVVNTQDKAAVVNSFFKTQLYFGLSFYVVNLALAFALYDSSVVHTLAILFGFNIILDNLINAIKSLNIAEFQQVKTFKILIIDSFLLCLTAAVLYIYPFSIVTLTIAQIIIRTITINLFLKLGSSELVSLSGILKYKVRFGAVKSLVLANWTFVIIGSISLLFWRSAQIIISKMLTLTDVAIYGVAYKIFQIALIIPFIISTTVFPSLVKKYKPDNLDDLRNYYQQVFLLYFSYGLLAFTAVYSFSDFLIPLIFGANYTNAVYYTKLMFLTVLVFPTAILQANLLVAMKLEKFDMIYNVVSLLLYLILTFVGLYFVKDLMVINLSIFFSFFLFHVLQDFLLVRKGVTTIQHVLMFYGISVACVLGYLLLVNLTNLYLAFFAIWLLIGIGVIIFLPKVNKMVKGLFSRKAKLEI
ncbi:oligosaccharide flippase family protein [Paracnuella aquatica]|uniref:oligosaccharide flippase family protein n=1 Tax=Paracnuella aquatica TaxID=2268757 RepID=UPI000DEFCAD8|nr:oligosaccharide flippase family protein [Paracnuella aquatica]RPD47274.1 hypothetical protein DRJ53_12245 [Paracnuella aquatica]